VNILKFTPTKQDNSSFETSNPNNMVSNKATFELNKWLQQDCDIRAKRSHNLVSSGAAKYVIALKPHIKGDNNSGFELIFLEMPKQETSKQEIPKQEMQDEMLSKQEIQEMQEQVMPKTKWLKERMQAVNQAAKYNGKIKTAKKQTSPREAKKQVRFERKCAKLRVEVNEMKSSNAQQVSMNSELLQKRTRVIHGPQYGVDERTLISDEYLGRDFFHDMQAWTQRATNLCRSYPRGERELIIPLQV
jgi:hypothetical protein